MSVFGSVLGGIGSLVGAGADIYNIGQQKKQFEWQKMAQEKTWAREDNATQRRVEDLKAAGLSPTLAAGSAAAASSPITPKAPQADMSNMMNGLAISNMVENIAKTKAEKKRIQQETEIVRHDFDKLKNTPMFYFNHHQDWPAVLASALVKLKDNIIGGDDGPLSKFPKLNISLGAKSDFSHLYSSDTAPGTVNIPVRKDQVKLDDLNYNRRDYIKEQILKNGMPYYVIEKKGYATTNKDGDLVMLPDERYPKGGGGAGAW